MASLAVPYGFRVFRITQGGDPHRVSRATGSPFMLRPSVAYTIEHPTTTAEWHLVKLAHYWVALTDSVEGVAVLHRGSWFSALDRLTNDLHDSLDTASGAAVDWGQLGFDLPANDP